MAFWNDPQKLVLIASVCFAGDQEDLGTIKLIKKYQNLRKKITQIVSEGDILETVLKELLNDG